MFADRYTLISDGNTFDQRRSYFELNFNDYIKTDTKTLNNTYAVMDEEAAMIQEALDKGIEPSEAYAEKENYFVTKYFLADPASTFLFINGADHMNQEATDSYQAGHAEAILTAIKGYKGTNEDTKRSLLVSAFAKEGYATHFLADRFASGHMRTSPKEIGLALRSDPGPQTVGALLSYYMHNEDNLFGLQVSNSRGDKWTSYGDSYYLDSKNATGRQLVDEAMQASADEVTIAFQTGFETSSDKYAALQIMSNLAELNDYIHYVDNLSKTIPMFIYDQSSDDVLRRVDLNMVHPDTIPINSSYMKNHGGIEGRHAMATLLELVIQYNPTAQKPEGFSLADYTTSDGELNDRGLQLLANSLNDIEKTLFCNDTAADVKFKNYLDCKNVKLNP